MQLNPFNDKPRLQLNEEERIALFEKAKSGDSSAIETFVFAEIDIAEKIILTQQHLDINGKCTFTDLYNCATNTIKYCIAKMEMPLYNKMVTWHVQKKIQSLIIENNNND